MSLKICLVLFEKIRFKNICKNYNIMNTTYILLILLSLYLNEKIQKILWFFCCLYFGIDLLIIKTQEFAEVIQTNDDIIMKIEKGLMVNFYFSSVAIYFSIITNMSVDVVHFMCLLFAIVLSYTCKYIIPMQNKLTHIPINVLTTHGSYVLNLSHNEISIIPTEIGSMTKLTILELNNNEISYVPPNIGFLKNLTILDLKNNGISIIPTEIGLLCNLTTLELNNNKLSIVPTEIGMLIKLKVLNLSNNQLIIIPTEFGLLCELVELYLNNNKLHYVPTEIGLLKNLSEINFNDNNLVAS